MNAPISRFTPVLLAGLAVLVAACSATGTGTGTAAPRGASSGPPQATSPGQASPGQSSPVQASPGQASSLPASATPGNPDAAPLCATTQLTLRIGGGLVSGGADIYYIYFKNTGATACTLRGYPGISAVTGPSDSASQIGSDAKRTATSPVASQLLKPGQSVQATLQFARAGNYVSPQCQHVNVTFLKIFPPGNTTAAYAGLDEQICAETTLPTMTIAAVIPDS
jgi:hypothetical protein